MKQSAPICHWKSSCTDSLIPFLQFLIPLLHHIESCFLVSFLRNKSFSVEIILNICQDTTWRTEIGKVASWQAPKDTYAHRRSLPTNCSGELCPSTVKGVWCIHVYRHSKKKKKVKKEKNIRHRAGKNRSFQEYWFIDLQTDNPERLPA